MKVFASFEEISPRGAQGEEGLPPGHGRVGNNPDEGG